MKLRLSLLTTVAVMALALFGVFNVSGHTIPQYPIQPFAADAKGGISTNQLGQPITGNWTVTQALQGERPTLPWIFSSGRADGTGFSVDLDLSIPDGTPVGTVWTNIDADCDGGTDFMADNCDDLDLGNYPGYEGRESPLTWLEATVQFPLPANEAFLTTIMPNPTVFPWLLRHKVAITHLCLGTGGGSATTTSVLNTVYAGIPFSPGGATFVAQTKLGGAPDTPPSKLCLDTPQTSESVTTVYNNPPTKGDVGLPAGDDGNGLYARWTILQSIGSTSLNKGGDLRKDYTSPPSIRSDTGYVERIIDLQCFWIDKDGCGAEGGAQCANNTDDDFDTVVNDGCPKVGLVAEAGGQCGDNVDALEEAGGIPDAINDGCPVAGNNCDVDSSGFLSEQETWLDDDMPAAYNLIDTDGDCLIEAQYAQPGQPVDTQDALSGTLCKTDPNWVIYSEYPIDPNPDKSADSDCDGLVDGIEYAYGSNPLLPDTDGDGATDFVEMFQFTDPTDTDTDDDGLLDKPENNYLAAAAGVGDPSGPETGTQCTNAVDDDNDGAVNDGCPKVGTLSETVALAQCDDDTDDDTTDTAETTAGRRVNDGCPTVTTEIVNLDDNCPGVANPNQLNSDGQHRPSGVKIPTGIASNPAQDKLGDACDDDDDNDLAIDTYEVDTTGGKATTLPLVFDSDGDTVGDGAEWHFNTNPNLSTSKPSWGDIPQVYYRGCHINTAKDTEHTYTDWDAEYDGLENDVEMDPDGDGIKCPQAGSGDKDSDNGTGTLAAAKFEVLDSIEAFGYGTGITQKDTDGDGCADWVEIHDLNGDRTVDSGDTGLMNKRAAGKITADSISDKIFDVNKDTFIDSGDTGNVNKNTCSVKSGTGGCPMCPAEN